MGVAGAVSPPLAPTRARQPCAYLAGGSFFGRLSDVPVSYMDFGVSIWIAVIAGWFPAAFGNSDCK